MRTEMKENNLEMVTGGAFTATVTGTSHYLAVRTDPTYESANEIEDLPLTVPFGCIAAKNRAGARWHRLFIFSVLMPCETFYVSSHNPL